jgi:type I restriction enzyme S subunit
MPKVNREHLFAYRSWIPSIEEQARLAARLDSVAGETERLAEVCNAKQAALDELKRSLLNQAFTGALTAKATDAQFADVA